MKFQIGVLSFLIFTCSIQAVVFQGILENGVTKNNFLCTGDAVNIANCTSADTGAQGFDLSNGQILQFFNDQASWLLLQAERQQYVSQNLRRTGAALTNKMQADGWVAMGGYCLIVSTNPLIADVVMPELQAGANQEKVVVQLWYNGNEQVQLWSQDAKILSSGQKFNVVVSTAVDSLPGITSTPQSSTTSLRFDFLSKLDLQMSDRKASVYNLAIASPRSVKIQGA